MGRRNRGSSDGSDLQPCHCQDCLKENPDGVHIPPSALTEHRHRERLRSTFLARAGRLDSASSSGVQEATEPHPRLYDAQVRPSETIWNSLPTTQTTSYSTDEDTDGWLKCVLSEISMRVETLYDSEPHLVFLKNPSPEMSFVFPDTESPLQANTGDFALQTKKIANHRLLDAEARFCHLLQAIQCLPVEQRMLDDVDVKEELSGALNKIYRIKERQWTSQAYPDGFGGFTVDNGFRFLQRRMTDVTPTLLAALIMYIKNRSSTRTMRVNLALLRCILRGFAKRHGIHTKVPSIIPKDIHTIVDHYDLNPTLHVSILCPRCYALYPFTDEELTKAEDAHKNNTPLPLCIEKSSPDSLSCGTTLWRTVRNGKQSFLAPIRKQVFQDLKAWIGRFLAIPGIEDTISKHQQRDPPPEAGPERDFVDSAVFRNFKGVDGQPFALPQIGPSGNPDLRLVMSLGFDGFNPFYQKETHAQVQSTALYFVLLSLPEHLRYRQEYMYLATVIPGKPKQHQINHTLRVIVNQLLPFWKGISYSRTARYHTGRTVFIALLPTVCDTEAAIQISGFAAHNHTYFCRRCLLSINNIHNLDSETWIMRDPDRHKQIAFEWKDAPQARREALYRDNGVRWTELLNLPYWNPILYTVIDDMHLGYLGLFKTHLRIIWGIDHEKSGGDGLCPITERQRKLSKASLRHLLNEIRARNPTLQQLLEKENKKVIWYLCFQLKLRTGAGSKQQMVEQILQWRSTIKPENVPQIPSLDYDSIPDGWVGDHPIMDPSNASSQDSESELSEVSFSSRASSVADPDMIPPVTKPAAAILFNRDQEFEELKSQLLDLGARAPSLSKHKKSVLQALCQDLSIPYNAKDIRRVLTGRLLLHRQENGADGDLYNSQLQYGKLKRNFEEDEPSKATLMSWPHKQLEQLCREYKIPPFDSNTLRSLKKEDMTRRLLLWRQEHRDSSLKQGSPRAVIGKDLLEEIWADMALSVLPSWIQPAPQKWGIPAAGKLSADEYKVVCSISLVITLIRVWGYENKEGPESRRYQMLLNFLDLVHSLHVIFLRETSQSSRVYYKATILKYLHGVLELFPDVVLSSNHHLALHVIDDLENLGPGHARSTPVFERINHSLQETKKNGHLGDIEATMLTSYGRMANLQILLDHFPELQEEIQEALTVLKDIEREDHRGMFAGTDLSAWSSTVFNETPIYVDDSTLDRIITHLCTKYHIHRSHWEGKVARQALRSDGVALGRVIYSPRRRESSIVFHGEGTILAGMIDTVIKHRHPHPVTQEVVTCTYLEVATMQPISEEDDLYRKLNCGWLCRQSLTTRRILIVPLTDVISHFVRTDLTIRVKGITVTHVYPVPKIFGDNDSGRPNPT